MASTAAAAALSEGESEISNKCCLLEESFTVIRTGLARIIIHSTPYSIQSGWQLHSIDEELIKNAVHD